MDQIPGQHKATSGRKGRVEVRRVLRLFSTVKSGYSILMLLTLTYESLAAYGSRLRTWTPSLTHPHARTCSWGMNDLLRGLRMGAVHRAPVPSQM